MSLNTDTDGEEGTLGREQEESLGEDRKSRCKVQRTSEARASDEDCQQEAVREPEGCKDCQQTKTSREIADSQKDCEHPGKGIFP